MDIGVVAQIDPMTDALVGEWLSLPDVADRLGLPAGRVKQLLREPETRSREPPRRAARGAGRLP